ncbi:Hypothetical predicted protein [Xyrichtys novacula]|uniref:Uncharacterized protein n=1 Tax=Xyrichtys novacula TaxID=13765 RepID=A0AAV1GE75_XYRNO|nr:Hypothetical predicted protein [Xyrichtys novacula]
MRLALNKAASGEAGKESAGEKRGERAGVEEGGRKIYVLCNKFLKLVHSPISFAGRGGIYDLYCSPSTEGAVLGVASPHEEADGVHSTLTGHFIRLIDLTEKQTIDAAW